MRQPPGGAIQPSRRHHDPVCGPGSHVELFPNLSHEPVDGVGVHVPSWFSGCSHEPVDGVGMICATPGHHVVGSTAAVHSSPPTETSGYRVALDTGSVSAFHRPVAGSRQSNLFDAEKA